MKHFSNINRIHSCWSRSEKEYDVSDIFLCHFFSCGHLLKIAILPARENFEPTKKNIWVTKYQREKIFDPRNTHEKIFWTHEIPARKSFGHMKYQRDNILDPRKTHEGTITQWRKTHDDTRLTKFSTLESTQELLLIKFYCHYFTYKRNFASSSIWRTY